MDLLAILSLNMAQETLWEFSQNLLRSMQLVPLFFLFISFSTFCERVVCSFYKFRNWLNKWAILKQNVAITIQQLTMILLQEFFRVKEYYIPIQFPDA